MTAHLAAMDVATRASRLRDGFDGLDADAMVVSRGINIRWLVGFTGSNGHLIVTRDRLLLITDARYTEQAAAELDAAGVEAEVLIVSGDVDSNIATSLDGYERIAVEAADLSASRHQKLVDLLAPRAVVATTEVIETLRQHKDGGEIDRLRAAAAIADLAFAEIQNLLHERPTERRLGAEIDYQMRLAGADELSFDTIVGSGPNGALPHAHPTNRIIEHGDLVVLDFGARLDGYGSDMTRTVIAGDAVTPRQQTLYDAVAEAQAAGVAVVRSGCAQLEVDEACRSVLANHGLAEAFIHGTGHGIGLEIHEQPILSSRSVGILRAGLVVTVEPGAYLPGYGGVRIEDSVVVTDQGCDPITHSPKGLLPDFERRVS